MKTAEMAANILQSRFETAVLEQDRLHELGCNGINYYYHNHYLYY